MILVCGAVGVGGFERRKSGEENNRQLVATRDSEVDRGGTESLGVFRLGFNVEIKCGCGFIKVAGHMLRYKSLFGSEPGLT